MCLWLFVDLAFIISAAKQRFSTFVVDLRAVSKHHWGSLNLNAEQKAAIERLAARYIWWKPVAKSVKTLELVAAQG